ncbi:MAG: MFS transporter [Comamonadaceae bacterium]|nr:MAG: MFS transporter [Comamonadaceae bacterium]
MPIQDGLPPRERFRALLVIIFAIVMTVLDGTIINLALPDITRDLNVSAAHSIWIINAYQIATLALILPLATLGDIVGYRKVYLVGLAVFTLASLACALSDSLATLTLARVLQGIGAAGIMSVNSAQVRLIYPRHLLGRGIAVSSMVVAVSSVAGPTVAALILSVASWPWLFAINIPIGIACLVVGRKTLPQNTSKATGSKLSLLDVALNALMFGLIVIGIDGLGVRVEGPSGTATPPWLSAGILAAGVLVGIYYVRRQLALTVPLFPVDLLRIPVFALSMGASIGAFSAQTLAYVGLPFLLLQAFGRSHVEAGMLLTAWPLGIVVVAPFAGRLIGRYPAGLLGGIGMALLAVGLLLLALLPLHPSNADIVWRMTLCGLGFGLFQAPNNHTILTSAPPHRSGGASGMLSAARLCGQTLGAIVLAIVFSFLGTEDGRGPIVALCLASAAAVFAGASSVLRVRAARLAA